MRLKDAGIREQTAAQNVVDALPGIASLPDFLDHGTYDPVTDELVLTVKAATYKWPVADWFQRGGDAA